MLAIMGSLFQDWLREGERQAINHQLRSVILEAVIYEGNQVQLKWR